MSIQQDKRVIKPSKMSERYARWFGTRVPSTSQMFRYIVVLALAIPWSVVGYVLISLPLMNLILVFLVACGVGAALYSLYLAALKDHLRSRTIDEQFSQIVELAHERVGSHGLVHVWQRKSREPYITSTFNSLFSAVIVSETMVNLILRMPASGEELLAFHLLRRPNHRNIMDIVGAVLVFSSFSTYIAYLPLSIPSYYPPYVLLILLTTNIGFWFFAPMVFMILLRGAFWAHDSAFERTAGTYKIHPQVARDEVLSSTKLDEEAAKAVVWTVKEWERAKRDSRRVSITVMVLIVAYLVIFSSLMLAGSYYYALSSSLYYLVLAAPLLLGICVYLVLRRWDKRCMDQIYYETTAAHEPIWTD